MDTAMSAAKILWGQILAVLIIIVASVWSATQWTASALGFQPELGAPWCNHPPTTASYGRAACALGRQLSAGGRCLEVFIW
jgi:type IV secretory pathway TraG/TraD family ATPase VirD4